MLFQTDVKKLLEKSAVGRNLNNIYLINGKFNRKQQNALNREVCNYFFNLGVRLEDSHCSCLAKAIAKAFPTESAVSISVFLHLKIVWKIFYESLPCNKISYMTNFRLEEFLKNISKQENYFRTLYKCAKKCFRGLGFF